MKFLRSFLSSLVVLFIGASFVSATSVHVNVEVNVGGHPQHADHAHEIAHCDTSNSSSKYDGLFLEFPVDVCDRLALFEKFHQHHQRDEFHHPKQHFKGMEEFHQWIKTAERIHQHNTQGDASFFMRMNPFGHLGQEEFWNRMGMTHEEHREFSDWKESLEPMAEADDALDASGYPSSLDWRDRGAVTSVKNQGSCGSCWAFGSVVSLEGLNFRKTGRLVDLSEQQLVDCDSNMILKYVSQGCRGNYGSSAMGYVKDHGICSFADYPYVDASEADPSWFHPSGIHDCKPCTPVLHINGYKSISSNEGAIVAALQSGPVSVRVHADDIFMHYGGGVLDGPCDGGFLNLKPQYHMIAIVGYTPSWWIVKNSWDTNWGESGYVRIARGHNQCGINEAVIQPY